MNKLSIVLLILGLCLCLCGCKRHREVLVNCKYKGGIIMEKNDGRSYGGPVHYDIKYNGSVIHWVEVYDIDGGYNLGDTINGECR